MSLPVSIISTMGETIVISKKTLFPSVILFLIIHAGCSGRIMGGENRPDGTYDPNAKLNCDERSPVEAPLRRLSSAELENVVDDLFNGLVSVEVNLPSSDGLAFSGFSTEPEANPVNARLIEAQLEAAEAIALSAVGALPALLPCASSDPGESCARTFIDRYAGRAMRRPVESGVRDELLAAYRLGTREGFEGGMATMIAHLFMRPETLYLIERGDKDRGGVLELRAEELAARLSFFLWGSIPDEALWAKAEDGSILDESVLREEAERLLDDPKAIRGVGRFIREWARVEALDPTEKDPALYPGFDRELAASMITELEHFALDLFRNGELGDLYGSNETYIDANLAAFYGVDASPSGFEKVSLPGDARRGVLTKPAILASLASAREGNYIQRGKFVLEQVLCQPVPAPPSDALAQNPSFPEGASNRETSEIRRAIPSCTNCHELLDGIGLSFDHFGAAGEYRETDSLGRPIDDSGQVIASVDIAGDYEGVGELSDKLVGSEDARACMSVQVFRYAFSRREANEDLCAIREIDTEFESSGRALRSLLLAVASSDAMKNRKLRKGD